MSLNPEYDPDHDPKLPYRDSLILLIVVLVVIALWACLG